ncbi:MAG: hypothetical protein KDA37_01440 [Planctomycetales bacterium]|nr:hypothetical protein [Planctomycetales bacterium]
MNPPSTIDPFILTPVVRNATRIHNLELLDWQIQPLQGGFGDLGAGLVGIYRLSGQAHAQEQDVPWSLVLKSTPSADSEDAFAYLNREWHAYQSGYLQALTADLSAPHCYGTTESGQMRQIWMEDLGSETSQSWTLDSFALTARVFGGWNGRSLRTGGVPDFPWFCRSAAREWHLQAAPEIQALRTHPDHPLIHRLYPQDHAAAVLQLWDDRSLFLDALARLPQAVCHNDAFRRNLFIKSPHAGHGQVVALDWAYLGWGALGEEVAAMVAGNLLFDEIPLADIDVYAAAIYDAYLTGLQASGWVGDPRLMRLGFTAAAAMKYVFPFLLHQLITADDPTWFVELFGLDDADTLRATLEKRRLILALADEARTLINQLSP